MYPKYKILQLLDDIALELLDKLSITDQQCIFHVIHSKTKDKQKHHLVRDFHDAVAGAIFSDKKNIIDIVIFYDKCKSKKDAIGSIIHELLHVAYNELLKNYVKTKSKKDRERVEEDFVSSLEKTHLFLLSKDFKV